MNRSHTSSPHSAGIRLRPTPLWIYVRDRTAQMHPAYFAFVMATGIVAIGCHLLGLHALAWGLAHVNLLAYPALWLCFAARAIFFGKQVWSDCNSHQRAPGFFTLVAATSIIGVQLNLLHGQPEIAKGLWWLTLLLWSITTYGILQLLIAREQKPTLAGGINGGWLTVVVATQSLVVLGCTAGKEPLGDDFLLVLLCFWLSGGMLYLVLISMIFQRYLFSEVMPSDLLPPYWINMGAVAISALAGALLCMAALHSEFLNALLPFIKGIAIAFWAIATWWIPMLVILGVWRHVIKRYPISYEPLYWSMVFPLGMYAVCSFRLGNALSAPFMIGVAKLFVAVAALVWTLTFLGMARRMVFSLALAVHQLKLAKRQASAAENSDQPKEKAPDEYRPCPVLL